LNCLIILVCQLSELLHGTLLVNWVSFLHLRLSLEKAFAGAYHGSGESRMFQLNSGQPPLSTKSKLVGWAVGWVILTLFGSPRMARDNASTSRSVNPTGPLGSNKEPSGRIDGGRCYLVGSLVAKGASE